MYKPFFGNFRQIAFENENDYYELLGFLAKPGVCSLVWENNQDQGAWGSEGRIKFYVSHIPVSCSLTLTSGVGNVTYRVNCNEFVANIVRNHHFVVNGPQNINAIRATIPAQFMQDFDRGLSL